MAGDELFPVGQLDNKKRLVDMDDQSVAEVVVVGVAPAGGGNDAFGRARVAEPETLADYQAQYDTAPLLWEDIIVTGGSVTHQPNSSTVLMRVTGANASSVARQTREYHRYQPGKSQLITATAVLGAPATNIRRRVGYFDTANGVYFEQLSTGMAVNIRTKTSGTVVDAPVVQALWNLDPLDGTGRSGVSVDFSKAQIFVIDLQWLGVGRARVGVNFGGAMLYCHEFTQENALTTTYMTTANLPVRYEITATGVAAQADLIQICASVISEGGFEDGREYHFSANMTTTPTTVGVRQSVFAIRPVGTWSPSGVVMRGKITPEAFSIRATTNSYLIEVVYAPTIIGGTWTAVGTASGVEWDRSGTLSGGYVIHSEYVDVPGAGASARNSVSGDLDFHLPLALDASGSNPIPLALAVTGIGGSVGVLAAMSWKENR